MKDSRRLATHSRSSRGVRYAVKWSRSTVPPPRIRFWYAFCGPVSYGLPKRKPTWVFLPSAVGAEGKAGVPRLGGAGKPGGLLF
jgi:hypothetical protein